MTKPPLPLLESQSAKPLGLCNYSCNKDTYLVVSIADTKNPFSFCYLPVPGNLNMADDLCCFFTKLPKKSALLWRMVVLMLSTLSGVYICAECLRHISARSSEHRSSVQVMRPCQQPYVEPVEKPLVHYPKPRTFNSCNPVRYFAILSTQRSGSGWFETFLNSHANISSNGEIFSVKVRRSNISTIVETLDKLYNLEIFTSASKNECTAAVGLKWMLNQGLMQYHEEIAEYFVRRGVSVIFFFRRNLLRRMVSVLANSSDKKAKLLNGTHKSHVHCPLEAEILASYKPIIDPTLLIPNLMIIENMVTKSLEYFKSTRHIALYYEDTVKNRTKLTDVQDFLRVPRMELYSSQIKIHKGPVSSLLENWADVENTLTGTPYESFLWTDYNT